MRITGIGIDCFGALAEVSLKDLPPRITLLQGENEAGKSTLLAFVRWMLFGPPARKREGWRYENPCKGGMSGRLIVMSDRLGELRLERRSGRGEGLQVSRADGEPLPPGSIDGILRGMTPELHTQAFAFSLSELQDVSTLRNDAIRAAMYGMGASPGARRLGEVQKRLREYMESLFKPRGHKSEINRIKVELESVRRDLARAYRSSDRYDETVRELARLDGLIADLDEREREIKDEENRLEVPRRLKKPWEELVAAESRLSALPAKIDRFPENGVERLDALREKLERYREEKSACEERIRTLEAKIENLTVDERILDAEVAIKEAIEGKVLYRNRLETVSQKKAEIESLKADLARALAGLGKDWSEELISALPRDLFTRERLLEYRMKLDDVSLRREKALHQLAVREEELSEALLQEESARKTFQDAGTPAHGCDPRLIETLEGERSRIIDISRRLPVARSDLDNAKRLFNETLAALGAGWDADRLRAVGVTPSWQEAYSALEREADSLEKDLAAVENRIRSKEEEMKTHLASLSEREAATSGPAWWGAERERIRRAMAEIRKLGELILERERTEPEVSRLDGLIHEKRIEIASLSAAGKRKKRMRLFSALALFLLLVSGTTALFLRGMDKETILAGLSALAGTGIFLGFQERERRKDFHTFTKRLENEEADLEARIQKTRKSLDELAGRIRALAENLGMPADPDRDTLDQALDKLGLELARLDRAEGITQVMARLDEEKARLVHERECLVRAIGEKRDMMKNMMLDMGLPDTGKIPRSWELFPPIQIALNHLLRVEGLEREVSSLDVSLAEFISRASAIPEIADAASSGPERVLDTLRNLVVRERDVARRIDMRSLAEKELREAASRRERIEAGILDIRRKIKEIDREATEISGSWNAWLSRFRFPEGLSPATAIDALGIIEECARIITRKSNLLREVDDLEGQCKAYLDRASSLISQVTGAPPGSGDILGGIDELDRACRESVKNMDIRRECLKNLEDARSREGVLSAAISEGMERFSMLMNEGEAAGEEDFRRRAAIFREQEGLRVEISRLEAVLCHVSGQKDLDALKRTMTLPETVDAESRLADMTAVKKNLARERDEAYSRKAQLLQEQKTLASSDDLFRLRSQEETLEDEIRAYGRKWCAHAIALHLIEETRRRYERERQPKVIRDASMFFSTITNGNYSRIVAPLGEESFEVETASGKRKKIGELSRGTAEQLYLALRFGYIVNSCAEGEPIPILMDDILVNFDPKRASSTARAIGGLAERHQVFFLTCHPSTARCFVDNVPDVSVISLDGAWHDGAATRT